MAIWFHSVGGPLQISCPQPVLNSSKQTGLGRCTIWKLTSSEISLLHTGCHSVSPHVASVSLELLAKCNLRRVSTVPLNLGEEGTSQTQVLRQVCEVYMCSACEVG